MAKIYTRKGDDGTTSLWYGGRVPKNDPRPEAYGTLDEANAVLGIARAHCEDQRLADDILRLQSELFVAGAELATAVESRERLEQGISRTTDEMVAALEADIDFYMEQVDLPPKFVIPGGTVLSAELDTARAVLRRAERRMAALPEDYELTDSVLMRYVNRASDLLFAMARYADEPEPELFEGRRKRSGEQG
jgi:cob(I)alamin adenosyltransferase